MTVDEREQRALRRLLAEVRSDLSAVDRLDHEIEALRAREDLHRETAVHAALAFRLEQFYTAVEALLQRIARNVDGTVPTGEGWHTELLHVMTLDVDEVRPAVLSRETESPLRRLPGLRHFLRHTYAVTLDPDKLLERASDASAAAAALCDDVRSFERFAHDVLDAAPGPS